MPKNPKASFVVEPKHTVGFLLRLLQHTLRQAMDDALRKKGVELSFAAVVALFGLHFEPGDPEDLAAKVEWAWTHPREMAAMGRAARAEYKSKYTAERNYQLLMEIYSQARSATAWKAT